MLESSRCERARFALSGHYCVSAECRDFCVRTSRLTSSLPVQGSHRPPADSRGSPQLLPTPCHPLAVALPDLAVAFGTWQAKGILAEFKIVGTFECSPAAPDLE